MADMETRRERITNLVTVTLVTVLIWIWAAGETREEITSFSDLRFTGQTRDSVRISPEELTSVSFQVRGPRREVDAVASRFREALEVPIGTLGVPSAPGEHEIDLLGARPGVPRRGRDRGDRAGRGSPDGPDHDRVAGASTGSGGR